MQILVGNRNVVRRSLLIARKERCRGPELTKTIRPPDLTFARSTSSASTTAGWDGSVARIDEMFRYSPISPIGRNSRLQRVRRNLIGNLRLSLDRATHRRGFAFSSATSLEPERIRLRELKWAQASSFNCATLRRQPKSNAPARPVFATRGAGAPLFPIGGGKTLFAPVKFKLSLGHFCPCHASGD